MLQKHLSQTIHKLPNYV